MSVSYRNRQDPLTIFSAEGQGLAGGFGNTMRSVSLYTMIGLTGMIFGAEIVSSHLTQSLVLLINAYHQLYNILSLLLLVISYRLSSGKTLKNTFGWVRVKVLGHLVNMLFLGSLCFAVSVEAVQTIVHASHENTEPRYPWLIIILGITDFIVNVICFFLIGGYTHHQGCSMVIQGDDVHMNCVLTVDGSNDCTEIEDAATKETVKSSSTGWCWDHQLLDVSRDISSCLTVVSCGCIVLLMDGLILKYADAILALASVIVLTSTTYPFVRESGLILLQGIPNHIDLERLKKRLCIEFPEIINVHDLHIWRLTTSEVIATVHVILPDPHVYIRIERPLTQFFQEEGIKSVTVQPEFTKKIWNEKQAMECILQCSSNNNCGALTCCGPMLEHTKSSFRYRCTASQERRVSEEKMNCVGSGVTSLSNLAVANYDFGRIPTAIETTV